MHHPSTPTKPAQKALFVSPSGLSVVPTETESTAGSDASYVPSVGIPSSSEDSLGERRKETKMHLVSDASLSRLLIHCLDCGSAVIESKQVIHGSLVTVHSTCARGCSTTWHSQELLNNRQPIGMFKALHSVD